jgi:hypothetical protein
VSLCLFSLFGYRGVNSVSVDNIDELKEILTPRIMIPEIAEDVNIKSINVFFKSGNNGIIRPRKSEDVSRYYIFTDKYTVEAEFDIKGGINPLKRSDYKETVIVGGLPVYVFFDPDDIEGVLHADLYLLTIGFDQVIAISMYKEVSDADAFYNENYPYLMGIMTDMLESYQSNIIW